MDENDLLQIKNGNRNAFAQCVRLYQNMVYSIAYHNLGEPSTAQDIAQEVFIQMHRDIGRIESLQHLLFWLRRITAHRCIDHVRRTRHWKVESETDIPDNRTIEKKDDPLLDTILRNLVLALPAKQRMIMTLRFQEDMMPSEIAEVLEIPVNTVKSIIQRALQSIQSKVILFKESC